MKTPTPRQEFIRASLDFVAAYLERQRLKKERNACKCPEESSATEEDKGSPPCWKYADADPSPALCDACQRREALHKSYGEQRKRTESARRRMFRIAAKL